MTFYIYSGASLDLSTAEKLNLSKKEVSKRRNRVDPAKYSPFQSDVPTSEQAWFCIVAVLTNWNYEYNVHVGPAQGSGESDYPLYLVHSTQDMSRNLSSSLLKRRYVNLQNELMN